MAWIELRDVGVCSLLLLLVALCFYNSLQNDFTFDDHLAIEQNFDMDERQVFSHLWVHDIWGKDLIEPDSHKSYRPLLISVFRFFWLNARKPMYYRIANIVSHAISTILVYFLAKQVFKGVKEHGGLMSIAAALFFATHPVHVEAVTAIVNLAEPLSSIFLIIAYFIFRADVYTTEGKGKALHSIVAGLLWLVCTVLAILIKETGIISSIFVWSFCGVLVVRSIWSKMTGGSHSFHLRGWVVCWWLALSSLLVYFYFSLRNVLVHHHRDQILGDWQRLLHEVIFFFKSNQAGSYLNSSQLLRRAENPFAFLKGEEKVFSMLHLYFRYVWVMLYPTEQSPEYSFNCIPSISERQDPRNVFSLIMIATVIGLILCGIAMLLVNKKTKPSEESVAKKDVVVGKKLKEKEKVVEVDKSPDVSKVETSSVTKTELLEILMWILVPFIPISGIIFTLGTLLAERLLYVPSIGYCLLLSWLVISVFNRIIPSTASWKKLLMMAVVMSTVAFYSQRTMEYNHAWQSDETLFHHAVKVCPTSAKSNLQVSKIYSNRKDFKTAGEYVVRAKEVDPEFCDVGYQEALLIIGNADQNDPEEYLEAIDRAIEVALKNLQCIYTSKQSLQLLNQLWDYQMTYATTQRIEAKKSTMAMMAKQARQAMKGELPILAAKKYAEASSLAYELTLFESAIKMVDRADVAMKKHLELTEAQHVHEAEKTSIYLLNCRIQTLSGTMRSTMSDSNNDQNPLIQAAIRKVGDSEFSRATILRKLMQATNTTCIERTLAIADRANALDHIKIAALHAAKYYSQNFKLQDTSKAMYYARIMSLSFLSIAKDGQLQDQNAETRQLRQQAFSIWDYLAKANYISKDYGPASRFYAMAIVSSTISDMNWMLYAVAKMDEGSKSVQSHADLWKKLPMEIQSKIPDQSASLCAIYYWYSDSLLGMPKVYEHIEVVELLVKNLQTHLVCRSKVKDKSQLNRLPGKSVVKKLILKFEKVVCRLRGLCTDEEMRQYDRNVGVNDDGDDDYDDEDA